MEDKQLLRVQFNFTYFQDEIVEFNGDIRKGLRTSIWFDDINVNTAVVIVPISKEKIVCGETCLIEGILLQPYVFGNNLKEGNIFNFGNPSKKIATGKIEKLLGYWDTNEPLP